MSEPIQDPPVPPEVDLRGLDYMPFRGHHLLGSEFHARCNDAEWRAGVTLWWAAWNQVPASSLPDDDVALARLADLGRDVKAWKKLRANALHGFVKCSDGRLYHHFLAAQALIAWDKRKKEREKKRLWRQGKTVDKTVTTAGTEPGQPKGQNGDGTGTRGVDGTDDVTRRDVTGHSEPSGFTGKASNATSPSVDNSGKPDGETQGSKPVGNGSRWWDTNEGIEAKGRELNFPAKPGELHGMYKQRLFAEIERKRKVSA
jgi:hypothetical protein